MTDEGLQMKRSLNLLTINHSTCLFYLRPFLAQIRVRRRFPAEASQVCIRALWSAFMNMYGAPTEVNAVCNRTRILFR